MGQAVMLKGQVIDATTAEPIASAKVLIRNTKFRTLTDAHGDFHFIQNSVLAGEQVLVIEHEAFIIKNIPIVIQTDQTLELDVILMDPDPQALEGSLGMISLTDAQLEDDQGEVFNISGLLQASRDVFLNVAAFEFSSTFFRPRGLDNAYSKVLINGIEMNKQNSGRPQWANWGGLNDVQRKRTYSMGLKANDYSFGDLAGTSHINMRASLFQNGGRLSLAIANRSYQGRALATYSPGLTSTGWAFVISLGHRYGLEGFVDGNPYQASSLFVGVERKLGHKHSVNLSAIYTPNSSGRSTAITHEVKELRGIAYNPNWGEQQGVNRNSRMRRVEEPILIVNHYWNLSEKARLNTNFGFQFGRIGTTRIDNGGTRLVAYNGQEIYLGGGRNPLPNYYQRLPSYFLRNNNPSPYDRYLAHLAEQDFVQDGQLDWEALYRANSITVSTGGNSVYVQQEDRTDEQMLNLNTILNVDLSPRLKLDASLNFRQVNSQNFALLYDLLGGAGYLDVDFFAEDDVDVVVGDLAQSDLQNRNRVALEGERYKYNYSLKSIAADGFAQLQFAHKRFDFFFAARIGQTGYQRFGLYENGHFPGSRSLGASPRISFTTYGGKLGGLYEHAGRHQMELNAGYFTKAPVLRNSFGNARQNNDPVIGLSPERILGADLSYIYRSPQLKGRLTGYYNTIQDRSELSFYFTENVSGLGREQDAFIQEVTTAIDTRSMGAELGVEAQVSPTIKLRLAAALGQHVYTNNPDLYITSDDFDGRLTFGDGNAKLKNYHVAGGPEQAFNLGFEYRDPAFWWFGLSGNHFRNAFIDINNLARTANYTSDFDGHPFNDYNEIRARQLLKQERFDSYFLVNLAGGKSWKVRQNIVGFFATIYNLLGQEYVSGGFEQGRYANYRDMQTDQNRTYGPLFGPRYFYGLGTTFFMNLYLRF